MDETPVAITAKSPICRIRVGRAFEVLSGILKIIHGLHPLKVQIRFRSGKQKKNLW